MLKRKTSDGSIEHASLLHFTWPIFIDLLLQMLVGNVDQFMLSHYSEGAVAAAGNANQILNLLLLMFNIISLATTIMVSQYLGAGNPHKVSEIYTIAVLVNVAFSLVISAALLLFSPQIYTLMKVPADIMPQAIAYSNIVGAFMFTQALYSTFVAIFRSNALFKETMIVSAVVNLLNIAGNTILIGGLGPIPAMGVSGAAISTSVSRLIGVVVVIVIFIRKSPIKMSFRCLRPFPWRTMRTMLSIGIPAGGESLSYNFSQMCLLAFVNTLGTYVITTRMYANMFAWFSYIYAAAISQASQIIVGHLVGAGKMEQTNKRVWKTLRQGVVVSLTISVMMFLCSDVIYGVFTSSPEIKQLGRIIFFVEIFLETGRAVNMTLIRALQAAGDVKFPVGVGIVMMWAVSVVLGFLFGIVFGWGLVGIWVAMTLDECGRAVVFLIRWKSGVWRTKSFVRAEVDGVSLPSANDADSMPISDTRNLKTQSAAGCVESDEALCKE